MKQKRMKVKMSESQFRYKRAGFDDLTSRMYRMKRAGFTPRDGKRVRYDSSEPKHD